MLLPESDLPHASILVAMTRDRLIGTGTSLPWHLPEDLALFRRLTLGNTVIMGHNTFRSIGSPLAGRANIVLSRTITELEGVLVCHSFAESLGVARELGKPLFFIGGAEVYRQALPVVDTLHISWVKGTFRGDRYFPEIDFGGWQEREVCEFNGFRYVRYQQVTQHIS
ncbi:MAG: dihydrofolate reductase [Desulfuromonas sp.]|nr:MAG: dihydrofolate reductase [Desulfuromonas sp.]